VLTIALEETGAGLDVVFDDQKARRGAASLHLQVQGTLACLLIAKATGRIGQVRPLLVQLRRNGIYMSDQLVARVLKQVGE
jgi:predicted nucleic acid-binding protein